MQRTGHQAKAKLMKSVLSASLLLCSTALMAQSQKTGVITDSNGEPLVGVTVMEVGTKNGTVTDAGGRYTLTTTKPGAKLRVSYVGFKDQTINPGQSIQLQEDNNNLNEVVVVGYGTMRRKDVTSSISTVQSKDLNVGSYTDPGQLLQGKVPGLVIVQNSDPNGGVNSLTLRGASTLNGSTAPLYVVDGIPDVNLNLISPADIETIDVLRDASATAIYGSKAANGVIMITTKKGQDGPARVTYSGYVAMDKVANDLKMMTADELRAYAKENNITLPNDKGANTNWQDEIERTGLAHNHNLSISGGNKKTSYTVSANYIARNAALKGVGNNLFTVRSNVETKLLKDHLTISAGINGNVRNEWGVSRNSEGNSVYDAMYYYSPVVPIRNEDGLWYEDLSISQNYNPDALLHEDVSRATYKRLQAVADAKLEIVKGLTLTSNFSYQTQNYSYKDYNSTKSQTVKRNGQTSRNVTEDYRKLFELYANYDHVFNKVHTLGLMAGYSWEENQTDEGFGARGYNFYNDDLWWNNIGMANSWDADPVWANVKSTTRMISYFGRANYSYHSRYMVQAAVRRDGSSTFGENHRWATFPSFSAAWRISDEPFMRNQHIFDDLKFHAGWGQSGNAAGFDIWTSRFYYDAGSRFNYIAKDGTVTSYKSLNAARNVNNDLKWETTSMLNLGFDMTLLKGRLSATIEYYDKETKDMIWTYPVSTTKYPVGWMVANVGKMSNKGVELSLHAVPFQTQDFRWNIDFNMSHNKNKVKSLSNDKYNAGVLNRYNPNLPGASTATIQRIIEGRPIGTFYMWEWAGYNDQGISQYYVHDEKTGERTGETTTTPQEKDRTIVGNAQPKLTLAWNNTFNYKKWDLNIFFTGVFGQKIFNELKAYYSYVPNVATGKNILKDAATEQKITDTNCSLPSDRYLENGSYFKLTTATLGYTFDNCFDGWIKSIRLYVSGNNLFTITGYSGRDPEINLGGETPGVDTRSDHFPRTRQFLFGATINF